MVKSITQSLIATAVLLHVGELFFVYPNHLGFFNFLSGGGRSGQRHLLNSNLDWGQDLILLKRWMADKRASHPPYLVYYGCCSPKDLGVDFKLPSPVSPFSTTAPQAIDGQEARYFVVSVNILSGILSRPVPHESGAWVTLDPQAFCSQISHIDRWDKIGASLYAAQVLEVNH